MLSYIFSGQGSQYVGMGKEFYDSYKCVRNVFECGSDLLGFDMKKACFEYTSDMQSKTIISQPIIFTMSLACLEVAKQYLPKPTAVAGHSLGEYSALVCSGIVDMEKGFKLIKYRSEAMNEATENSNGEMYAILKSDTKTIEKICEETRGYVIPVNYNSPMQTVIAGEANATSLAVKRLEEEGAKAVKLAVSCAFHSKLMENASKTFYEKIKDVSYSEPNCDFYSNITGEKVEKFDDLAKYLATHIVSPVYFTKELHSMYNNGITKFVELGPNKVLSGLVKRTLDDVVSTNIENSRSLQKTIENVRI